MKTPSWLKMIQNKKPPKAVNVEAEIKSLKQDVADSESSLVDIENRLRSAKISALADPSGQGTVDAIELEKRQTENKIDACNNVLADLEKLHEKALLADRLSRQEEINIELAELEKRRETLKEELFVQAARCVWLAREVTGKFSLRCGRLLAPSPCPGEFKDTFFFKPLEELIDGNGEALGVRIQKLKYERAQIRLKGRLAD